MIDIDHYMNKKFQVIVSDPPWVFSDSLTMDDVPRGAAANYPLLDLEEIKKLKVSEVADPNGCVLVLWVPSSLLQDGLDVMKAWGFDQKQTYIWVKTKKDPLSSVKSLIPKLAKQWLKDNVVESIAASEVKEVVSKALDSFSMHDVLAFFMGRLFRQTHEIALVGTNNNKIYKKLMNKSQRSVSFGENLKHSAKPEHLQDSLDLMFPGTEKLEMFARRVRPGWHCVGNEICNGEDIRDSLNKLL